jgi:hypothetical protein
MQRCGGSSEDPHTEDEARQTADPVVAHPDLTRSKRSMRVFAVLFCVAEIWRTGQNKTMNTYH